jgi:hypothetical protein
VTELEPRVIEGRVITDGVAQNVTREDGVVRVRLTVFGELASKLDYEAMAAGAPATIPIPRPVEIPAGETVMVEIDWRPGPVQESGPGSGTGQGGTPGRPAIQ